jgi:hypothetical protein
MEKLVAFLFLLLLAPIGCSFNADYDRRLNKYASEYANEVDHSKKYLAMLEAHDFTTIEEKLDPSLKNTYQNSYELSQSVGLKDDKLHSMLDKMASLFPTGDPTDVKLVGIIRNYSGNYFSGRIGDFLLAGGTESTTAVSYEYNFSGKWLQANVVLRSKDNEIYGSSLFQVGRASRNPPAMR